MKYIVSIILLSLSSLVSASDGTSTLKEQVLKISELYGDGFSKVIDSSIETQKVTSAKTGYCVNLISFAMEGFSGGNNYSQFIVFVKCKSKTGDSNGSSDIRANKLHVMGIHPLYLHRDSLDLSTASYEDRIVSISTKSNKKVYSFTSKKSIWWYRNN